jgi:putative oxidoreductase
VNHERNPLSSFRRPSVDRPSVRIGRLRQTHHYGATTALIASVGLPVPPFAYALAVVLELGGGLLLVAGYKVRPVAAALALFSVVCVVYFHSNFADQNQMIHFLKNIMLTGKLLQIVALGAGALSIDKRLSNGSAAFAKVALAR